MDSKYIIKQESEIESIIGFPLDIVKSKVLNKLDEIMKEFIGRSPLVFMSTIDEKGHVDVSPKGDPCGFVKVGASGNLLIPDRPGNKLTFGHRNIIRNGEIGLIFLVPNQRETLRVKGIATLHNDPNILAELQVNNKPALLCTSIEVKECFMHCGKALIRSKLWQPEAWDTSETSLGTKQFAPIFGGGTDENAVQKTQDLLDKAYKDELY
jgi:PPOX class probable FMN-dependent enzyme